MMRFTNVTEEDGYTSDDRADIESQQNCLTDFSVTLNDYLKQAYQKESNIKEYFLSDNETTPYIILEQNKDIALLRRFTPDPKNDPTPYIVASGLNIKDNNLIEWDSGYYRNSIIDASLVYADFTNIKINVKQELTDEQSYDVQRILENTMSFIPYNKKNEQTISEFDKLTSEILNNQLYEHKITNKDVKSLFTDGTNQINRASDDIIYPQQQNRGR